jgi:sulfite dehydrogenase
MNRALNLFATIGFGLMVCRATALDIQLPPETGAFKQAAGADLANGQCLVCHSVEYVVMQPPMSRTFWNAEVTKMKAKYGAQFPDSQVEPLVDYLTLNYGIAASVTNSKASGLAAATTSSQTNSAITLATKWGCLLCHQPQTKLVGPAYKDVAAKYQNDPSAVAKIDEQIHNGGSGKWGAVMMPPFPQLTPEEAKMLAEWILAMK